MTAAFIALHHNDSDIGRFRRSSEYPEDRKALSTRAVFDFLWITSPTSVMFAVAISTYCACTRPFLKQIHFYNLMAVCFYGVTMLLLLVWKPLEVASRFMSADELAFLYTMYNSFFFSSAAVFVLPGPGKKSWKVIRVSIGGAAVLFVYIVWFYAYMTDTNAAPLSSQLTASFVSAGIFLAAFMEVVFTFRTLSLSRIATLTEAKRYVLFVIILLLYTGYCISGIYEGLVREAAVVLVTMLSFGFSTILKYFWEQVSGR